MGIISNDEETGIMEIAKPVVALIAGKNAPKDTSMGHAGAIVSPDGEGSAENKETALRGAGVYIAEGTEDLVEIVEKIVTKILKEGTNG